jgi:short-subunit dehydrogenase
MAKKTVVITGAGTGLGAKIAKHFTEKDWDVIATVFNEKEKIEAEQNPNVTAYPVNLANYDEIETFCETIFSKDIQINALINNAGMGLRSPIELATKDRIDLIVKVNYLAIVYLMKAFIPHFRKYNDGTFVNISSIAGLVNLPMGSYYHSTKQAIESFTECSQYELGKFGIKTRTVQFGALPTNFSKNASLADFPEEYQSMINKINATLNKNRTKKDNTEMVVAGIFKATTDPKVKFKQYSLGMDPKFMKNAHRFLGKNLFTRLVKSNLKW